MYSYMLDIGPLCYDFKWNHMTLVTSIVYMFFIFRRNFKRFNQIRMFLVRISANWANGFDNEQMMILNRTLIIIINVERN